MTKSTCVQCGGETIAPEFRCEACEITDRRRFGVSEIPVLKPVDVRPVKLDPEKWT